MNMQKEEQDNTAQDNTAAQQRGEALSRLMDGDLGEFELRRLLQDQDPAHEDRARQWQRYHATRAVLRGERPALGDMDLSGRVREAIAGEAVPAADGRTSASRPWGGVAIAASVALAAVFLVRMMDSGAPGGVAPQPEVAEAPLAAPQAPVTVAREEPPEIIRATNPPALSTRPPQPNLYLVRHAEFSSLSGAGGIMPFARVSSRDSAE